MLKREGVIGRILKLTTLVVVTVSMIAFTPTPRAQAATITQLEQQLQQLKDQQVASQKKIDQAKRDASNLKDAISGLDEDIGATSGKITNTQSQIDATNAVIDALNTDIGATTDQLSQLTSKLNSAYGDLFITMQTSSFEVLLQSDSIDTAVTQSNYIEGIQRDLQKNIDKANVLKADLESKKKDNEAHKADLQGLSNDLNSEKSSLNNQKQQKNYLLNQTQGDQAKYEQLVKNLQSEATKISAELYQKRLALGGYIGSGGTGGYPYATATPDTPDPWGFLKRECTSYASWKFLQNFGQPFINTRPGSGSAYNWPNLAHDQGFHTSSSPQV